MADDVRDKFVQWVVKRFRAGRDSMDIAKECDQPEHIVVKALHLGLAADTAIRDRRAAARAGT